MGSRISCFTDANSRSGRTRSVASTGQAAGQAASQAAKTAGPPRPVPSGADGASGTDKGAGGASGGPPDSSSANPGSGGGGTSGGGGQDGSQGGGVPDRTGCSCGG
jgi:hypothetical protein